MAERGLSARGGQNEGIFFGFSTLASTQTEGMGLVVEIS
jgi:hypothetical protein